MAALDAGAVDGLAAILDRLGPKKYLARVGWGLA